MMKFRLIAAAVIAGAVTLLSSGTAYANYPEPAITLTIDDADIIGGTTFSFTAKSGTTPCSWTVTYADGRAAGVPAVQTGSGTTFTGSYKTKKVTSVFKSPITAVCRYDDGQPASTDDAGTTAPAFYSATGSSAVQAGLAAAPQQAAASAIVTLRPLGSGSDDGDALPDTGGFSFSLILLAAGLLALGGGVTYLARRRFSSH